MTKFYLYWTDGGENHGFEQFDSIRKVEDRMDELNELYNYRAVPERTLDMKVIIGEPFPFKEKVDA